MFIQLGANRIKNVVQQKGQRITYKSHPTDWEKPGIKPGPLVYKAYATGGEFSCLWPCFLAIASTGWVYVFCVVLCPGAPEGSTGRGSGFNASQKTGHGFKSHPTDWEKVGIEHVIPGLQDIGLFPTPWRRRISHF